MIRAADHSALTGGPRKIALFAYGFRPFFLLAALDAIANMIIWLVAFLNPRLWPDRAGPAMYWHAHEMLFGFVAAAIAGFLLTAVPGWTGRKSYAGIPLYSMTGLWLAGRIAMAPWPSSVALATSLVDLAFFPALVVAVAPTLIKARKFRNLPFIGLLALLFLANLCFHLGRLGLLNVGEHIGLAIAIDIILILITVVGGRIIPAFTRSGLARPGAAVDIQSRKWLEIASTVSILAVLAGDIAAPLSQMNGLIALAAALIQALRLGQWEGYRTLRNPLVWILHLGYLWLVLGLLLKAAWLLAAPPWSDKWIHALTAGAFTTMILAVMTRASLGHTGRALIAPRPVAVCYMLISLAALVRVLGPSALPVSYNWIVLASGSIWIGAFGLFLWIFFPILVRPRIDGKPG